MGKTKTEAVETANAPVKAAPVEDTYPLKDLVNASRQVFGVQPEVVVAALRGTNKKEYTVSEVRTAVKEFMKKEVR